MADQNQQQAQQYTVAVETLRSNHEALQSYLLDTYGPQRLEELPDIGAAFSSANPGDRVPVQNISIGITMIADFLNEPNLGLKMAGYLERTYSRVILFSNHVDIRFLDFLKLIARYMRVTSEIFEYEITLTEKEIEFKLIPISPETISYHQCEGLCALIMRAIRDYDQIRLSRINFSHTKPVNDDQVYLDAYQILPTFEQGSSCINFPIECRDIVISRDDSSEDNIKELQSYEIQFSKLKDDACILDRCKFLLPLLLCLGEANKERLADLLCLSPRTLQRKLKERETSFREVLQNVRVDLSEHYFLKTGATCSELCFALGYQDYKQFNRAFKEWFGIAPEEFRGKVLAG